MSTSTHVNLGASRQGARAEGARFIQGTAAVPLVVTVLLSVLTLPIYVLAPTTIPAVAALLAAGATYYIGSRRLARGVAGARRMVGLAALGGLAAVALACFTSWHLAGEYHASSAVAPCCGVAFAVPTAIYAVAAALIWRTARRGTRGA